MNGRRAGHAFRSANVLLEPGAWDNLRLTWRLARDRRVAPTLKMIVPIAVMLYLISPIDLLPDFLLGIGQVDDIGVLGVAMLIAYRLLPRLAPAEVLAEHLRDMGLATDPVTNSPRPEPEPDVIDTAFRVRDTPSTSRQTMHSKGAT